MLQCDNLPVPAGVGTFTWRLGVKSSPDIPRFIIVGFQQKNTTIKQKTPQYLTIARLEIFTLH